MTTWKIAFATLAAGLAGLTVAADDPKTDFAGWVKSGTVRGLVEKSDKEKLTLKIVTGRTRTGPKFEKLDYMYHENGLVRWKKLPPKTNAEGRREPYTQEELTELRMPRGAPGYAAGRDSLKPDYLVELTLVRPKEIPAAKAVFQDLRIQYLVILTEDKDATAGNTPDEDKGDEKKSEKKDDKKKDDK